ncbi:hypothetical protein QL285_058717 [Trifolium repens]|nr:hypothetical protein QL285_058717 [Trifolium repens]
MNTDDDDVDNLVSCIILLSPYQASCNDLVMSFIMCCLSVSVYLSAYYETHNELIDMQTRKGNTLCNSLPGRCSILGMVKEV